MYYLIIYQRYHFSEDPDWDVGSWQNHYHVSEEENLQETVLKLKDEGEHRVRDIKVFQLGGLYMPPGGWEK